MPSILDTLDAAEREATAAPWETKRWPHRGTEVIGPADPARPGHRHLVTPKEASEIAVLSRNHLRALIDVARAADTCAPILHRVLGAAGINLTPGYMLIAALAPLLEPDDV